MKTRTQEPTEESKTTPLLTKKDLKKGTMGSKEYDGQINCCTAEVYKTRGKFFYSEKRSLDNYSSPKNHYPIQSDEMADMMNVGDANFSTKHQSAPQSREYSISEGMLHKSEFANTTGSELS